MRSQNPQCFKGFLASNNKFHAFFRYNVRAERALHF